MGVSVITTADMILTRQDAALLWINFLPKCHQAFSNTKNEAAASQAWQQHNEKADNYINATINWELVHDEMLIFRIFKLWIYLWIYLIFISSLHFSYPNYSES